MNAKLVFGTSGYDYPEWRGVFYPRTLDRQDFLAYYAQVFSALEINYSYYHMPTEYEFRSMYKKSGGSLVFSVKAPHELTHTVSSGWQLDAQRFRDALLPFVNGAVLSSVLFQFPQRFHYTPENRMYLDKLLSFFSGIPSVVEFRHTQWQTERVYEGLEKRNAGICVCDAPQISSLPSFTPVVTGKSGYIRFHGRNANAWYAAQGKNGSGRYAYLYTEKELHDVVPELTAMAARSELLQVFFNNHPDGAAAVNARMMAKML